MELDQAKKRAEELRAIIEKNNRLYYDQDAPELEDFEYDALNRELKALEAQGVEIQTCGTCLNFYGLTEKLAVGSVTNMYSIVEKLTQAGSVVKP